MKKLLLLLIVTFSLLNAKTVVAFAQDNMGYIWKRIQINEIKKLFENDDNIEFIYKDGKAKIAKQISDIEYFTNQNVDILIVSPINADMVVPALENAYKKGIKIVFAIRNANTNHYTTYIHPSDKEIGQNAAKYIAKTVKNPRIVMLQGRAGANTVKMRRDGFLEEIAKYPNAVVVANKIANYKREQALTKMDEIIKEGIKFNAVYTHNDAMLDGVRVALKKNNIDLSKVVMVGIDYILEAQKAIAKNEQSATFTYPTCSIEIYNNIQKIIKGEKIEKDIIVPSQIITKDNYKEINPLF
jgi:ribose transport system substrate-binding protein